MPFSRLLPENNPIKSKSQILNGHKLLLLLLFTCFLIFHLLILEKNMTWIVFVRLNHFVKNSVEISNRINCCGKNTSTHLRH